LGNPLLFSISELPALELKLKKTLPGFGARSFYPEMQQ
jgi:hypothetical protein